MTLETTLFPLEGLERLKASYRLYRMKGLTGLDASEYHTNVNVLVRRLSFTMKAPFVSLSQGGEQLIAVPHSVTDFPMHHHVVRAMVTLEPTGQTLDLSFNQGPDALDGLRLRYLDFVLQRPLFRHYELWQPSAGQPFFQKEPLKRLDDLLLFHGVSVRAARHPEGGFGVVCDARSKFVAKRSIGARADRKRLSRLLRRSCLYQMGDNWYQFRIDAISDSKVGEPALMEDKTAISLAQQLVRTAGNAAPKSIIDLDPDGAVLEYFTSTGERRMAPAELCHLIEDTHGKNAARHQRQTILEPHERRDRVTSFIRSYLSEVEAGGVTLSALPQAFAFESTSFKPPSLRFGHDETLTPDLQKPLFGALSEYSKARRLLMLDTNKGFFHQSPLPPQTLVLPESVRTSWGPAFVSDFIRTVQRLYPSGGYAPEIVVYQDKAFGNGLPGQMKALTQVAESGDINSGDVLIMLNRVPGAAREQDRLAAMVCNEFEARYGKRVQVMHSDSPSRGYKRIVNNGVPSYVRQKGGRMNIDGYLKGAALNKVCLGNSRWPFVLADPLNADVTIGIDVKNNMAVFTLVADGGCIVRVQRSKSKQKEQLLEAQVLQVVTEMLGKDLHLLKEPVRTVVVHRDGRAWPTEIAGVEKAFAEFAQAQLVHSDVEVTVFEILKSSPAPLRLFGFEEPTSKNPKGVTNPVLGSWFALSETDGYVCTTGAPLLRQGTADPLHVRRASGPMGIEDGLRDIYALSCLTWPKPDGCMRLPLTIKLCDVALFDDAATYDMDVVRFSEGASGEASA